MNKKDITILVSLLILMAGFLVFYKLNKPEPADIRKFTGGIVSVEGRTITIHGVFSAPIVPLELGEPRNFSFQADNATVFQKTEINFPAWPKLKGGGQVSGRINLNDLPRVKTTGSLEDIKGLFSSEPNNLYVEVDFPHSIADAENPVAGSIYYEVILGLSIL